MLQTNCLVLEKMSLRGILIGLHFTDDWLLSLYDRDYHTVLTTTYLNVKQQFSNSTLKPESHVGLTDTICTCDWNRWDFGTHLQKLNVVNTHVLWNKYTVKPVCNDHVYNKIYYLWFIQWCVVMMTEGTNLLLLKFLPSAAYLGGPWPPRWAPEGREVSH